MSVMDALRPVLDAVEIVSSTSLRFAGTPHERPAPTPAAAAAAEADGTVMIPLLTEVLYGGCYVRPFGWASGDAPPPVSAAEDDLLPALTAAHPGRDRWDDGWEVRQALATGRVIATRHGQARFFWPGEFVLANGPGMPPRPGARIRAWMPRESQTLQPGFYYAFGAAQGDADAPLARLYWNVAAHAAPTLLAMLVSAFDRYGIPFRFKCLSRASHYPRTDAAVAYVPRRHWHLAAELALGIRAQLASGVDADVPLFTLPLAPGLGAAEDPATGESFGMNRCRFVAEGVWAAWKAGKRSGDARRAAVADAFRRGGVDPERPWMAAGSTTRYHEVPRAA